VERKWDFPLHARRGISHNWGPLFCPLALDFCLLARPHRVCMFAGWAKSRGPPVIHARSGGPRRLGSPYLDSGIAVDQTMRPERTDLEILRRTEVEVELSRQNILRFG
jgi:hypothetical protein